MLNPYKEHYLMNIRFWDLIWKNSILVFNVQVTWSKDVEDNRRLYFIKLWFLQAFCHIIQASLKSLEGYQSSMKKLAKRNCLGKIYAHNICKPGNRVFFQCFCIINDAQLYHAFKTCSFEYLKRVLGII